MRHTITQEDIMGCGAACVAFAANVNYQDAVNVLGREKAKTRGLHLQELVDGLNIFGLSYQFKHMKPKLKKHMYNDGTIVFIARSKRYPYGHYLIRHENLWADPWINLVLDKNLSQAASGYRQRLPGKVQWILFSHKKAQTVK